MSAQTGSRIEFVTKIYDHYLSKSTPYLSKSTPYGCFGIRSDDDDEDSDDDNDDNDTDDDESKSMPISCTHYLLSAFHILLQSSIK